LGRLSALKTILSSAVCIDFLVPLYLVWCILFSRTLAISTFIYILNGCTQLQMKLESISEEIGTFYQNGEFIERYRHVESRESRIEVLHDTTKTDFYEDFEKLELCNICFNYGAEKFSLHNINLTIKKGEKIAIVGPNGSGKTTLVKLLLRLYDANEGEIRLNGKPIRNMPIKSYRDTFSTLFQEFGIYSMSIAKNVAMDKDINLDRVKDSLIRANFSDIAEQSNQRLDRELYEDGLSFSGGQLQRLALSRILYEDHKVLIMDEPTSAMDVVFETQFYNMILNEYGDDKTIVFVSHRLSSCVLCDKIIYMENGNIAESGSHEELMTLGGKYYQMFKTQADFILSSK